MRVVIVGVAQARARLIAQLPDGVEVIGEARTLREAKTMAPADAYVIAASAASAPLLDDEDQLVEPLTARELDVLTLLSQGLPNKSIAAALGISDQTVKFHVAAIYGKLGATNRTDAARRALRLGLIPL
jgi:two-component system nitrate/nitrite response regulator NarL